MSMKITLSQRFSFEDVLTTTWKLFRDDPAVYILFPLMATLPISLLTQYLFSMGATSLSGDAAETMLTGILTDMWPVVVIAYIILIVVSFISPLAIAYIAEAHMHDRTIRLIDVINKSFARLLPYIGTSLFQSFLLFFLFLLLIVPGIICMIYWIFTAPIVTLRGKWGWAALSYSMRLVRKNWLRVCAYSIILSVMIWVPLSLVSAVIEFRLSNELLGVILQIPFQTAATAFSLLFSVVFFCYLEKEYNLKQKQSVES